MTTSANDLDKEASQFLLALPSLEDLTLISCFRQHTFKAVLLRHGPTLRQLLMRPHAGLVLSHHRIREIEQRCQNLERVNWLSAGARAVRKKWPSTAPEGGCPD